MHYNIAKPSAFLARYVKHYWTMNHCLPDDSYHTQRIIPSGLFELIFYMDENRFQSTATSHSLTA
ncbi:MAG: hypothetical protein HC831_29200 [Chloroflexia bacterium]|nr:hypothetical protein [Chloroflexia bacterium]